MSRRPNTYRCKRHLRALVCPECDPRAVSIRSVKELRFATGGTLWLEYSPGARLCSRELRFVLEMVLAMESHEAEAAKIAEKTAARAAEESE